MFQAHEMSLWKLPSRYTIRHSVFFLKIRVNVFVMYIFRYEGVTEVVKNPEHCDAASERLNMLLVN